MARRTSNLKEFEIRLKVTKGEEPNEFGFFPNPPIVVRAKNKKTARRKLRLPKRVKIRSIKEV